MINSILTFYSVIFLCFVIPNCFSWDFGDISNRIHAVCTLKCDFNLVINKDEFYCDRSCQDDMCKQGCGLYSDAVTTYTCSDVCVNHIHQSLNISEAHSDVRLTQVPKQSCTQGCSFGLDEYYAELTKDLEGVLPPPVPVLESIGHDHIELSWEYDSLFENLTFFLQKKIIDTNTDWQVHTATTTLPSGNFYVSGLHPYITYQFKIIFEFTTVHAVETSESAPITTKSHGVPSSSPSIISISTPSTTVISISWEPPIYTNGPLLSYRITVSPDDSSKHKIQNDVSPDIHSWIFGHLHAGQKYEVFVSAVNEEGEGPAHSRGVTTPPAGNLSEHETPYLILGADNMVVKLRLLELVHRDAEPVLTKPRSILVTGVGVHVERQLVLVADDTGVVTLTSLADDQQADDIYPMLIQPTAIDIDWLHDLAYVVDGYRVYQCSIRWIGNHCKKVLELGPNGVREIKVDPINGFLYFNTFDLKGLFRKDLAHFQDDDSPLIPLIESDLHTFVLDYDSFLLYIPNNPQNTIMSAYLDGTGLTDVRQGTVVRPYFINIASMVLYDGKFFWTNGSVLYSEEFDKNRTYYHNALALLEKHFCGFNLYYPKAQPVPIPTNPPANVQVLFTAYKAIIQWEVPQKLQFQGEGAYKNWFYEVNILQDDGSHNSYHQTGKQLDLVVTNLEPDTQYKVKVRAKSSSGTGPWSEVFNGRTLKEELDSVELLVAVRHQYKMWEIKQFAIDGEDERMLVETSPLSPGVTDLVWFQDKIFWTSEEGELFLFDGDTTKMLDFVSDASCMAIDWLAQKIYWSIYKNGVIKRADMYGQSIEFVYQALARDMVIDSIQGRIYWVTMNSMETANLNGDNPLTYFSVPYFSGNYVISLTLDLDLHKVFWYVKGFQNEDLYIADMVGYGNHNVVKSVKLVANFQDVAKFSVLKYFSSRLFWLDNNESIVVGDTHCNYSSSLSRIGSQVTMFNIRHPSLQPYPDNLNRDTVCVIPKTIPAVSVRAVGSWSHFNVTWQPSSEVNHGRVSYEVSLETDITVKVIMITENSWYDLQGLPPYTLVTVTVRAYTYWGLGPLTTTTIRSPMSVPDAPQVPKVYVTQRKNAASSKVTLAADFRWSEPESINGILNRQHVFYWKSSMPHQISSTALSASARHFILDGLQGNTTYFFQVEACTEVGCGAKSIVANATADAVNPVPKLLIATETSVVLAEPDNIVNTSVTVATRSTIAMAYLAQEDVLYWINRDMYLEAYQESKVKKLFQLEGAVADLAIDWISRTIFTAENTDTEGHIRSYEIDRNQQSLILTRPNKIGNVVLDPYTSFTIWSEEDSADKVWHMYRSHITGQNITRFFSDSPRQKRAVSAPCNCHSNRQSASALAMDLSQDGLTKVIFVDDGNNIVAADVYGCHCQTLLTTTAQDSKGLPPDVLTVDHVHIYWYNKSQGQLYMLDKESGKLSSTVATGIRDLFPYGAHLQPLPASECLDISPYTDPVDIISMTNTSVTVHLHPVTWPDTCENISQPSVRYIVYYRKLDDMNPSDHCGPTGQQCFVKESYSREITVDNLDPYTYYIIQGAVSNYYTQYSATSLGEPTSIRTKPGVPSCVGNISASPQTPNSIAIMWPPPEYPNGPLDKIEYYIRWTTQTKQGISKAVMTNATRYDALDPYNGHFSRTIENLSPSQKYIVQVICNQTLGNYVRESDPVRVMTYDEPDDIHLADNTNTTIAVEWTSPSDDSVSMFSIYYARVHDGPLVYESFDLPKIADNFTLYNVSFDSLQPNTEYSFRLNIIYRASYKVYHWPQDGSHTKYIFKTLTGIPGFPEPPVIEEITNGEFEVSWVPPHDFGENITHYLLQYRHIDKENWSFAVNTTDTRWVLDDGTLPRGFTYVFRVKAQNKNGWGPYSSNSSMFSYPILQAKSDDTMMTVVAIVCALVVVLIAMVTIAICFTVCRARREERKKKTEFIAVARGPDLELATLRELPTTVIHQNNTLYAINMVPTDDDIAALPHFRRDQLVLCKFLGSGAFGEVFEGVAKNIINENSGDTKVAVKTLRKSASDQEKEEFLKEALLMSNFRHAHILSLLGVCLDNDPQFIILELMEGGDLLSFMRACRLSSIQNRSELSLTDLVKICVHVARGCKYLEDMHFVHRDLAARNCLVSSCNPSEMVVKIGDFGLARDIYKNDYYRKEGEGLLPVRWMSPESLMDGVFTTQSDIWAFGVLMWEVVTFGQQPYPARTNIEVLHYVRSGGRLDRPDNCPEDFYQLMCKCWSFASEDRPSFAYLLQQLEQFQETCASISEYLVPIRSSNQPIAAVAGLNYLTRRKERVRSTSSDGAEYYHITHTPYGSHRMYGSIRRATSFDAPEPKDATQQICTDASNYLEPKSCGHAQYIEFLPDDRTKDYIYNSEGERVRDNTNIPRGEDKRSEKVPLYVQTTVKENEHYNSTDNMKYINQKNVLSPALEEHNNVKYVYIDKKVNGRNASTYDTISVSCMDPDKVSSREADGTALTNQRRDSSVSSNQNLQISAEDLKYATIKYTRSRKQRLDSSTSCKSFDSVQTEPAYYPESQTHRNILNSSSSSRSNYSMSHIPEHAPISSEYFVTEKNEEDKYWANNNSSVTYTKCISPAEMRGYVDYLNTARRSQVYPESAGALAGYDIVQSSLV